MISSSTSRRCRSNSRADSPGDPAAWSAWLRRMGQADTVDPVPARRQFDPQKPGILEDEYGPLWYRGLSGEEPQAPTETVDAILANHGAKHIVVGHTPTSGVIWPRYEGKVIMIDTGLCSIA